MVPRLRFGLLCGTLSFFAACERRPVEKSPPAASDHQALAAALAPPSSVGQRCALCHAEIVGQFAASGMSRSWRAASPDVAAAVAGTPTVHDAAAGYRYTIRGTDGVLEQIETHHADPLHRTARRADYLVGSGHHALAFVHSDRGYFTQLPVGWASAGGGQWRMNPGYELKNHRFSRPVIAGCVACHATTAQTEPPSPNRFQEPIADGIDCSRCHGDAGEHIRYWEKNTDKEPPAAARLISPSQLTPAQANDVCLQCHLQGDVTVEIGGHSAFDFSPGQRLLDHRHDFLIAGQPEMLGVASHGARMLQSKCYIASGGELTCIHCHDTHQPSAAISRGVYDAKCAACHASDACSRPADATANASSCIACHMPQRPTREGVHLVFTDHAIPRRPTATTSTEPPLLPPNSAVQLTSAWPGQAPDEATLGAAYALVHETMGPQLPALDRAIGLLTSALERDPSDATSRFWLGSANLARGKSSEALGQFREVLQQQPVHPQARYRLGLALEAANELRAASAEYERLLVQTPSWLEPHSRLAQLYLALKQPAEAVRVLEVQITHQASPSALASLALAQRMAGASHEAAMATIQRAIELDSRLPQAYVTRGTLWLLVRDPQRARADFQRALQLDPHNAVARQALQQL